MHPRLRQRLGTTHTPREPRVYLSIKGLRDQSRKRTVIRSWRGPEIVMSEVICRSKAARKDIFTDESDFSQQTWMAGLINAVGAPGGLIRNVRVITWLGFMVWKKLFLSFRWKWRRLRAAVGRRWN